MTIEGQGGRASSSHEQPRKDCAAPILGARSNWHVQLADLGSSKANAFFHMKRKHTSYQRPDTTHMTTSAGLQGMCQ